MAPDITIIAAVAKNKVIGADGEMPWYYPADLKHFRSQTMGHPVIMGRVTFESIVDAVGGPLDGRHNIVLSTSMEPSDDPDVTVVRTLDDALATAREVDSSEHFIAGGASVYEQALPHATRMMLTEVPLSPDGDTSFPDWSEEAWVVTEKQSHEDLTFLTYEKR